MDSETVSVEKHMGTTDESRAEALKRTETRESQIEYPQGPKLLVIILCLYMSMFLIALDRTIIATAIPRITDTFNSIDDIGWYGSAYLLAACGFILVYGRVYTFYSTKWVFLSGIILFELGSAVCGAAPSSNALIIGRAIAGFGSSGIMTGAITILVSTVPLQKRPLYQGLFGAVFGVASVAGPLLGGAFTDSKATWRWCFYINLPIGAFTIVGLILFLHLNERDKKKMTLWEQFLSLDPIGTAFFLPSIICLLLALQWGGSVYPWSEWRIIVLLVFFSILMVGFIVTQYVTRNTTATIPARIITQRSVAFGCFFTFCIGSAMMTEVYFLPLWFQAIKGVTALNSGLMMLPMILSLVVASIICGALVQKIGYYTPFMYLGTILVSIGTGLLTTFTTTTPHSKWIGYQVIVGLGIGSSFQQANLAAQVVLAHRDVPTGSAMVFFCQTFGGAIFVSVGQNVFLDKLIARVGATIPASVINPAVIAKTGATELRNFVPPAALPAVLQAYNWALMHGPMVVGVCIACFCVIGAAGMEWRNLKTKGHDKYAKKDAETGDAEAEEAEAAAAAGGALEPVEAVEEAEEAEEAEAPAKHPDTPTDAGTDADGLTERIMEKI